MLHNLSGLLFPGVHDKSVGPCLLPGSKILYTLPFCFSTYSPWFDVTNTTLQRAPQGVSPSD